MSTIPFNNRINEILKKVTLQNYYTTIYIYNWNNWTIYLSFIITK